jgi:hypothetical protein
VDSTVEELADMQPSVELDPEELAARQAEEADLEYFREPKKFLITPRPLMLFGTIIGHYLHMPKIGQ